MNPPSAVAMLHTGDAPADISQARGNGQRLFISAAGLRPQRTAAMHVLGGDGR